MLWPCLQSSWLAQIRGFRYLSLSRTPYTIYCLSSVNVQQYCLNLDLKWLVRAHHRKTLPRPNIFDLTKHIHFPRPTHISICMFLYTIHNLCVVWIQRTALHLVTNECLYVYLGVCAWVSLLLVSRLIDTYKYEKLDFLCDYCSNSAAIE